MKKQIGGQIDRQTDTKLHSQTHRHTNGPIESGIKD